MFKLKFQVNELKCRVQVIFNEKILVFNVAKYNLGKVKPERVGQWLSPLQYVTFGAALRVLQALFCLRGYCCLRSVALHADCSGSL